MKKTIFFLLAVMAFGLMGCQGSSPKPATKLLPDVNTPNDLGKCDMAIFEDGKVTFYNSSTNTFVPFTDEKDFVLSGVLYESDFYYTVSVDDELYLKKIDLSADKPAPVELTDWELKLSDCSSEDGDLVSSMGCVGRIPVITIRYNLFDEYAEFTDLRTYNPKNQKKADNRPVLEEGDDYLSEEDLSNDQDLFAKVEEELEMDEDEDGEGYKAYYYYVSNGDSICLSNQIDFDRFKSEYSYEPQFELLGIGPARNCALFAAPIDWGHVGHGPLCFASLDGKVQKVLVSDYQEACYGWFSDGRLAYVGNDGIYVLAPDGTEQKISSAQRFVTR